MTSVLLCNHTESWGGLLEIQWNKMHLLAPNKRTWRSFNMSCFRFSAECKPRTQETGFRSRFYQIFQKFLYKHFPRISETLHFLQHFESEGLNLFRGGGVIWSLWTILNHISLARWVRPDISPLKTLLLENWHSARGSCKKTLTLTPRPLPTVW